MKKLSILGMTLLLGAGLAFTLDVEKTTGKVAGSGKKATRPGNKDAKVFRKGALDTKIGGSTATGNKTNGPTPTAARQQPPPHREAPTPSPKTP